MVLKMIFWPHFEIIWLNMILEGRIAQTAPKVLKLDSIASREFTFSRKL